ncbi:MAG: sodium:proton antiporter [Ruminococcaceae bacterium]|nr:sodium:proton antiporter [Oscillospiraceae bacterium]
MDNVQILLSISICALSGLLMSRVCKLLKLPAVTGYLVAGILVGSFCLGRINIGGYYLGFGAADFSDIGVLGIVSEIALGFIAFSIGSEFRLSELKKTGKQATVIGIFQALATSAVCVLILYGLHLVLLSATGVDYLPIPAVLILSAIAAATAPAATLMVVRQYKAKGPLTNLLLPIVALDDAVGLVVFAILFGMAKAFQGGNLNPISIVVEPMIEIVASLILGAILGFVLSKLEKLFHSNSNRLSLVIAFVFATVALTQLKNIHISGVHIGFSSLLTCMMCGTVFCNVCECSDEMMSRADSWTKPLLIVFFVISGAELDLSVFAQPIFVLVGAVYIVARCLGKYFGAMSSARMTKCSPDIVKYLGITLFPQAGVALGMVSTVSSDGTISSEVASTVRFVILFAVLVYELFGPVATKWALTKAGDITEKPADSSKRRLNLPVRERHAKHH